MTSRQRPDLDQTGNQVICVLPLTSIRSNLTVIFREILRQSSTCPPIKTIKILVISESIFAKPSLLKGKTFSLHPVNLSEGKQVNPTGNLSRLALQEDCSSTRVRIRSSQKFQRTSLRAMTSMIVKGCQQQYV